VDAVEDVATLVAVRLALQEKPFTLPEGVDGERFGALVDLMRHARYGAFFFHSRAQPDDRRGDDWDEATRLVRDLNDSTRFVLLSLGGPGNLAGAEAALAWQGGFLQGVDYRLGRPSPSDDRATLDEILSSGEIDTLLVVADPMPAGLSPAALERLRGLPVVAVGPGATAPSDPMPAVAIRTAAAGLDPGGTVMRSDGVVLPVTPLRPARQPTDGDVLRAILADLRGATRS
jgi:formylmethanofuran dehydrogenase subunit B